MWMKTLICGAAFSTVAFAAPSLAQTGYTWPRAVAAQDTPWPEAYCGATAGRVGDIMTYDRATRTQVIVDNRRGVSVTARGQSGSSFSVQGDLATPAMPYACFTAGSDGYALTPNGPGSATVIGYDGETGRRFRITETGRSGSTYQVYDPETRRQTIVRTSPDGRTETTRGRALSDEHRCWALGLGVGAAVAAGRSSDPAIVGGGVGVGVGGCAR